MSDVTYIGLVALGNGMLAAIAFALLAVGAVIVIKYCWFPVERIYSRAVALDRAFLTNMPYFTGTAYNPAVRWSIFLGWSTITIGLVGFGGWKWVYPTLVVALVGNFYVVRHWLVDRDEKEKGLVFSGHKSALFYSNPFSTDKKLIDTDVTLTTEALASIALLFALAAMGFSRFDMASGALNALDGGILNRFTRAAAQVLGELPESVPISDASSALRDSNIVTHLKYGSDTLRDLTFALRLAYELFIVTAAFELIRSAQRMRQHSELELIESALDSQDPVRQANAASEVTKLALKGQVNATSYLVRILNSRGPDGAGRYSKLLREQAAKMLITIGAARGATTFVYEAIAFIEEELRLADFESDEWGRLQLQMATALTTLGELLEGRDQAYHRGNAKLALSRALRVFNVHHEPSEWASAEAMLIKLEAVTSPEKHEQNAAATVREMIAKLNGVSRELESAGLVEQQIGIQYGLARNYLELAELVDDDEQRAAAAQAVAVTSSLISRLSPEIDRQQWGAMQFVHAKAQAILANCDGSNAAEEHVLNALKSYQAAQSVAGIQANPKDWANITLLLSAAQEAIGRIYISTDRTPIGIHSLQQAIEGYEHALSVCANLNLLDNFVDAQVALTTTLLDLLDCIADSNDPHPELLERLVTVYRAIMRSTRDTAYFASEQWIRLQLRIGCAYISLISTVIGKRKTFLLEECYEIFRPAIQDDRTLISPALENEVLVRTAECLLIWAGELSGDRVFHKLNEAVVAAQSVLSSEEVDRQIEVKASALMDIGVAFRMLASRESGNDRTELLNKASTSFEKSDELLQSPAAVENIGWKKRGEIKWQLAEQFVLLARSFKEEARLSHLQAALAIFGEVPRYGRLGGLWQITRMNELRREIEGEVRNRKGEAWRASLANSTQ